MNKPSQEQLDQLTAKADKPIWVDSYEQLDEIADYWHSQTVLAIDTEFSKTDTFYAIPGLIQVADDKACYLIDPKAIADLSPLVAVFENADVVKILHAPSEDLELFDHCYGAKPTPMFDTQVAAAFLGLGNSMGLVRLLDHYLDITLSKQETTSNWLRRPLSVSQEKYAALDVTYLSTIYHMQVAQLQAQGKLDWAMQESAYLVEQSGEAHDDHENLHHKFGNLSRWPTHKQIALQLLLRWREGYARSEDVPRTRVMKNDVMIELINDWPHDLGELSKHKEFPRRIVRLHGTELLRMMSSAKKANLAEGFIPIPGQDQTVWRRQVTKKIKALVRATAAQLEIAPELLLRNKEIEAMFFDIRAIDTKKYQLPERFPQWRRDLIEEDVIKLTIR